MKVKTYLSGGAKVWLNRLDSSSQVVLVVSSYAPIGHQSYDLYPAYEQTEENLGKILFDTYGYWIYDGKDLAVMEREQVADFIINYVERM